MSHIPHVAVIVGSTREGRFGPVPARWITDRARQHGGLEVDVVDLADFRLPEVVDSVVMDPVRAPEVLALGERLAAADAFVVVTPVYNRGYPSSLKTAIDWYIDEWAAKPIGFVSYGGAGGGLYAVEQLRQVFTEVHAVTIRETIMFSQFWESFDAEGRPVRKEAVDGTAKVFLDQLTWWARTLSAGRAAQPYRL